MLRAVPVDAEELRDREFKLPQRSIRLGRETGQVNQTLDGTFSKGGLAQYQTTVIILDRAGENLRCRRTVAIHQYRQWPVVRYLRIRIIVDAQSPAVVTDLHDGTGFNEQPGQLRGLRQRPATIRAQIDQQTMDTFSLQLLDQAPHVACRTAEILLALFTGLEIRIKSRYPDNTDLYLASAIFYVQQRFLCCLLFQFDLIADQTNEFCRSIRWCTIRQ